MTTNTIVSTLALGIVDNDVLEITPRSAVEAKDLSKEQAKQSKLLEKEKAKQAKLQEKEQAKQAKLLEKQQAKKRRRSKKDQCEGPPEKRKRGRPQKEPKMITYLGGNNHDYIDSLEMTVMEAEYITEEEDEEMDSESDDEEETLVTEFTFQNKLYYKCEENTLYDPESHIELGYYNPIDKTIVLSDV